MNPKIAGLEHQHLVTSREQRVQKHSMVILSEILEGEATYAAARLWNIQIILRQTAGLRTNRAVLVA